MGKFLFLRYMLSRKIYTYEQNKNEKNLEKKRNKNFSPGLCEYIYLFIVVVVVGPVLENFHSLLLSVSHAAASVFTVTSDSRVKQGLNEKKVGTILFRKKTRMKFSKTTCR